MDSDQILKMAQAFERTAQSLSPRDRRSVEKANALEEKIDEEVAEVVRQQEALKEAPTPEFSVDKIKEKAGLTPKSS